MNRRQSIAVLAAVSVLGPEVALAQERPVLRGAGPPNDGFKAIYYGVRSGIFAKYGLTVEVNAVSSGAAAAAALVGGSVEFIMVDVVTLIRAHLRDIPIRIVAPNYWYSSEQPSTLMLVLKDSPVHNGRDLTGKTIAVPQLGSLSFFAMNAWIDQTGGDSKSIHAVEIVNSAIPVFVDQGRADAALLIEPFASQALATGRFRTLTAPLDAITKHFEAGAFAALEPFVEKNLETMSRFVRAVHEAAAYTNAHPAETVDLVASYTGASPEVVAKMSRATDPEYVDVRNIQPVIDVLAKYGAIDKAFPAPDIISSAALKP